MNHLSEEQLILHYYGETGDTLGCELHLEECEECRATYGSLQRVLNVVDSLQVPSRSADYGAQVWQRIESRLPVRRRLWSMPTPWRWAAALSAFASLLMVAFLAGRSYAPPGKPGKGFASKQGQLAVAGDVQSGERVLLVAVGDHLENAQMMLIELVNANPKGNLDISAEQQRAGDLVNENRLYRQTATSKGDTAVAGFLDELERVLLDITHAPSEVSPEELENLRQRFESEGILFKIRVMGSNVRHREEKAAGPNGHPAA
jgi:hypothetical protein